MAEPPRPLLESLAPEEIQILDELIAEFPGCDTYTLARFMRARQSQFQPAKQMFSNFLQWREEFGTDRIHDFEFPELPQVLQFYPHGFHKTDRLGRPIYIEQYGKLNLTELFNVTTQERMLQYYVKSYEKMLTEKFPACSAAAGYPVEQSLTILDLGGSAMSLMSKQVYDFIQLASSIAQDYYPEILGKMFVVNTPMLFSMVWKGVKPMLNEKTVNKISLEGSSYRPKLLELVAPENLPEFLGGTCRCPGGCLESSPGPWSSV